MAEDEGGRFQERFIIPPGTQVVLKGPRPVPGTGLMKLAGSVGEVIESPPSNLRPYTVRFADGVVLAVKFAELAVRRRELSEELGRAAEFLATPGEDLRRFAIYRVEVGSRAFGLATEESDEDVRGVYLPPAEMAWSLWKPPEEWQSSGEGRDEVYWEIEKFLRLSLQANPSILETLWTPRVLHTDELGRELRAMREAFLSRHIYKTYSGYALSQFQRMRNSIERKGTFKTKHAMHLLRLLLSGIHALRAGEVRVDVTEHREMLLSVKRGEVNFERVREMALELDREFQAELGRTRLPERPDYERVNRFLIRARRSRIDA